MKYPMTNIHLIEKGEKDLTCQYDCPVCGNTHTDTWTDWHLVRSFRECNGKTFCVEFKDRNFIEVK